MRVLPIAVREMGAAVRAVRLISSPYFAHARLQGELEGLLWRVTQLAERGPDHFAALAQDLGVSEEVEAVRNEIVRRASNLLIREHERQFQGRHGSRTARIPTPGRI